MAQLMKVVRAAKNMTWRQMLAISPLLFGKPTQTLASIAKQTGITKSTLVELLAPLADLLTLNGLDTRKPSASLHKVRRLTDHFTLTKSGHLQYFWLGVRGEACDLSMAENWLYWWWRSAVSAGLGKQSHKSAARLSGVSQPAALKATKELVAMGWLRVEGEGDDVGFVLGDVDLDQYYPDQPAKPVRPSRSLAALVRDTKPTKKRTPAPDEQILSTPPNRVRESRS